MLLYNQRKRNNGGLHNFSYWQWMAKRYYLSKKNKIKTSPLLIFTKKLHIDYILRIQNGINCHIQACSLLVKLTLITFYFFWFNKVSVSNSFRSWEVIKMLFYSPWLCTSTKNIFFKPLRMHKQEYWTFNLVFIEKTEAEWVSDLSRSCYFKYH